MIAMTYICGMRLKKREERSTKTYKTMIKSERKPTTKQNTDKGVRGCTDIKQ